MVNTDRLDEFNALLDMAKDALHSAHAPYSRFPVGAAVMTMDGKMYGGCNIENASYGLTVCAERVAIFSAVADGNRSSIQTLLLYTPTDRTYTPCGACRQVLAEFAAKEDCMVICCSDSSETPSYRFSELFPKAFAI
jgi:cytidine deaminase